MSTPKKAKQITAAEHFRLRLPSESPTWQDADMAGDILVFCSDNTVLCLDWKRPFDGLFHGAVGWLPGNLPTHLIPKAEEADRAKFEAWAKKELLPLRPKTVNGKPGYFSYATQTAWNAWQAKN